MLRFSLIAILLFMTVGVFAQETSAVLDIPKPSGIRPAYCDCPDFVLDEHRIFYPDAIEKSKNQIEVRLFQPSPSQVRLTILTYKDQKWGAAYYLKTQTASVNFKKDFPEGILKYQFHKFIVKNVKIDSVFFELVTANAFRFKVKRQGESNRGTIRLEYIINGQTGLSFLEEPALQAKEQMDERYIQNLAILNIFNKLTKNQGPNGLHE